MGITTFVIISNDGVILDVWSGGGEGIIKEKLKKICKFAGCKQL